MLQLAYEMDIFMEWTIEYFEQADTAQPAEIFEDVLGTTNSKFE
jgi:hypothetical protein